MTQNFNNNSKNDQNKKSVDAFNKNWEFALESKARGKQFSMTSEAQTNFFIEQRIKSLLKEFGKAKGKRLLHCGCGTGQWSIPFALNGFHVTNVDLSASAIELTEGLFAKMGLEGEFLVGDILNLPYDGEEFDVVISFGVLEHFDNINLPIAEMCRVLKPGGVFHADVIPKRFSVRFVEQLFTSVQILVFRLLTLRFNRLNDCVEPFFPDFYENSIPVSDYVVALTQSNMEKVQVFGVRAFPFLVLPRLLDEAYAWLLKSTSGVWSKFDNSGSSFSIKWGVIFSLIAVKK
jgi:ubiquinone/menaquinone biosynthesis C-methylase UbiE